jgi:hypothetical protein
MFLGIQAKDNPACSALCSRLEPFYEYTGC